MSVISIPEIIRLGREQIGLSQRELGIKLGYSAEHAQRYISNWESGKRPVPLDKLRSLAKALNIPLDFLIP